MAKYEKRLKGNFNEFLRWVDRDIMRGNASISYEDGSDVTIANTRVAVRVYERYSMTGSNRVSLNLTLVGVGEDLFVTAITSGEVRRFYSRLIHLVKKVFLGHVLTQ